MASNVIPAPAVTAFIRNRDNREKDLQTITFATRAILDDKKVVVKKDGTPLNYRVILDKFNDQCKKVQEVQAEIDSGAVISETLKNFHLKQKIGLDSIKEEVNKAAVKSGIIQQPAKSKSRLVLLASVGAGLGGVAASILYSDKIKNAALVLLDNAPSKEAILSKLPSLETLRSFLPSFDTVTYLGQQIPETSLATKIGVGVAGVGVIGAIKYRNAVARAVAFPFKASFNGLKNCFKNARNETAALQPAPDLVRARQ